MLSGTSAAMQYGYSSARVKAMEAELITKKAMQEIMNAKDISSMLAVLFQGDYRSEIESFGGLSIKQELIDFALSKNLARSSTKLVQISPTTERKIVRGIVGKWDLYNIKLALEAKGRKSDYESIAGFVVDFGRYNAAAIKEAMREESIEGMMNRFMMNSPYSAMLKSALESYKKSKDIAEAIAEIDKGYYKELGNIILGLRIRHNESALMVKMDIDMKNLMLLIKGKRAGFKFPEVSPYIVEHGRMSLAELEQLYNGTKDIEALVSQVKLYDLKGALEVYRSGKRKQLLVFEIGMKNAIFNESLRMLKHSILSIGAVLAYSYLKEIEIYTLRIIIHGRIYGLTREEMERLIVWRNE